MVKLFGHPENFRKYWIIKEHVHWTWWDTVYNTGWYLRVWRFSLNYIRDKGRIMGKYE